MIFISRCRPIQREPHQVEVKTASSEVSLTSHRSDAIFSAFLNYIYYLEYICKFSQVIARHLTALD